MFDVCDQDRDGYLNVKEVQLLVLLTSDGATSAGDMADGDAIQLMEAVGADPAVGLDLASLWQVYAQKVTSSDIGGDYEFVRAAIDTGSVGARQDMPSIAAVQAALRVVSGHLARA